MTLKIIKINHFNGKIIDKINITEIAHLVKCKQREKTNLGKFAQHQFSKKVRYNWNTFLLSNLWSILYLIWSMFSPLIFKTHPCYLILNLIEYKLCIQKEIHANAKDQKFCTNLILDVVFLPLVVNGFTQTAPL